MYVTFNINNEAFISIGANVWFFYCEPGHHSHVRYALCIIINLHMTVQYTVVVILLLAYTLVEDTILY